MKSPEPTRDSEYFLELQTQTGWGRTLESFARWCDPKPGSRTLDIGCGPGLLPAIFSKMGCSAVGVDLDLQMFRPSPLHPGVAVADVYCVPFGSDTFDLVTCSNLLFMLPDAAHALVEMSRLLRPGGKLAMLNPSELLNEQAAVNFANERQMDGLARSTFFRWAKRAEHNNRWSEEETAALYLQAGLRYGGSVLKIGPGFGRFSCGMK